MDTVDENASVSLEDSLRTGTDGPTVLWQPRDVSLRFLFGEKLLFTRRISSLERRHLELDEVADGAEYLPPRFQDHSADIQLILVRSQPVKKLLPRFTCCADYVRYVPSQYQRYYVDLRSSFDDYLMDFSAKSRSTLRRKVRSFEKESDGCLDVREFCLCQDVRDFQKISGALSPLTYQDRLLGVGLPSDEGYWQRMRDLACLGRFRGYVLFCKDEPVAFMLCTIVGKTIHYDFVGYDPAYRQRSPGIVLQYLVLKKLFTEGRLRWFDFTEGEGMHKKQFATDARLCADIYYFRRRARNLALLTLHSGLATLTASSVKLLELLGMKNGIKKYLRSKSA